MVNERRQNFLKLRGTPQTPKQSPAYRTLHERITAHRGNNPPEPEKIQALYAQMSEGEKAEYKSFLTSRRAEHGKLVANLRERAAIVGPRVTDQSLPQDTRDQYKREQSEVNFDIQTYTAEIKEMEIVSKALGFDGDSQNDTAQSSASGDEQS